MIDRRPIPSKEKNWKSSERMALAARSRETSKRLTHSLLPSIRALHRERICPRCTRVLWRDLYAQCNSRVDVGTRLRRDLVSFLSSSRPGKNCPTPHPSLRAGWRKMIGGAKGERHAMLEIDQWVFLALLAVRLAAWLRIYCVSIFRGTIVRSDAFIVALVPLVSCFPVNEMGMEKERGKIQRTFI